jgi:RNA polymerase sigma factor (TIGR02999 family)
MAEPSSSPPAGEITQLLSQARGGDRAAGAQVYALMYDELRRLAARLLFHEQPGHSLAPTALVHEAFLKLLGDSARDVSNRAHLMGVAARAMRQVLVEHARRRHAAKRGGGEAAVTLVDEIAPAEMPSEQLLALDEALTRLDEVSPRLRQVVECRFFAGLTEEETAATLGVTTRTVQRDWVRARAWLYDALYQQGSLAG